MNGIMNLLQLVHVLHQVEGRKKLQKIVHILQMAGNPFSEYFGYLHYGPYSSELASEVEALVDAGLVVEKGGEAQHPYTYTSTSEARKLLEQGGLSTEPSWGALATALNRRNAQFLEAVSTILYLRGKGIDMPLLQSKFSQLKPQLSGEFDVAYEYAEQVLRPSSTNQGEFN
jgi:uncharacterized protein YwgA